MIIIFIDLETTGTDLNTSGIHQISGAVEIDGKVVEEFDYKVRPHQGAIYSPGAMLICKVTKEELLSYPDRKEIYRKFTELLAKYVDKYDPKSKAHLCGFNNRAFDDPFLRTWFERNGDNYFGSYFYPDSLDAMVLASQYLLSRRAAMPSFKLKRVAKELGIVVDEAKLHNANYDIQLTRAIYRIVTGLEVEL